MCQYKNVATLRYQLFSLRFYCSMRSWSWKLVRETEGQEPQRPRLQFEGTLIVIGWVKLLPSPPL